MQNAIFENVRSISTLSYLIGILHIRELKARRQLFSDSEFYVYPLEAIQKLGAKIGMTADQFYTLDDYARQKAFTAKALANETLVGRLQELMKNAIADGDTKKNFLSKLKDADLLDSVGLGSKNWYWETVQRTNTMAAYNGGRMSEIANDEEIEYLEYIGIDDDRQSGICAALDGTILPKNDPFWATRIPPNHFNCRSTVRPIFRHTAEFSKTKITQRPPTEEPQEGFRSSPMAA